MYAFEDSDRGNPVGSVVKSKLQVSDYNVMISLGNALTIGCEIPHTHQDLTMTKFESYAGRKGQDIRKQRLGSDAS